MLGRNLGGVKPILTNVENKMVTVLRLPLERHNKLRHENTNTAMEMCQERSTSKFEKTLMVIVMKIIRKEMAYEEILQLLQKKEKQLIKLKKREQKTKELFMQEKQKHESKINLIRKKIFATLNP